MSSVKNEKLQNGLRRETRNYSGGASKSVTYKPTWLGRDIKSVTRSDGKKK